MVRPADNLQYSSSLPCVECERRLGCAQEAPRHGGFASSIAVKCLAVEHWSRQRRTWTRSDDHKDLRYRKEEQVSPLVEDWAEKFQLKDRSSINPEEAPRKTVSERKLQLHSHRTKR